MSQSRNQRRFAKKEAEKKGETLDFSRRIRNSKNLMFRSPTLQELREKNKLEINVGGEPKK